VRQFEMGFRYLELRFVGRLLVDGAGPKGAVREKPDALARARALGKSLA